MPVIPQSEQRVGLAQPSGQVVSTLSGAGIQRGFGELGTALTRRAARQELATDLEQREREKILAKAEERRAVAEATSDKVAFTVAEAIRVQAAKDEVGDDPKLAASVFERFTATEQEVKDTFTQGFSPDRLFRFDEKTAASRTASQIEVFDFGVSEGVRIRGDEFLSGMSALAGSKRVTSAEQMESFESLIADQVADGVEMGIRRDVAEIAGAQAIVAKKKEFKDFQENTSMEELTSEPNQYVIDSESGVYDGLDPGVRKRHLDMARESVNQQAANTATRIEAQNNITMASEFKRISDGESKLPDIEAKFISGEFSALQRDLAFGVRRAFKPGEFELRDAYANQVADTIADLQGRLRVRVENGELNSAEEKAKALNEVSVFLKNMDEGFVRFGGTPEQIADAHAAANMLFQKFGSAQMIKDLAEGLDPSDNWIPWTGSDKTAATQFDEAKTTIFAKLPVSVARDAAFRGNYNRHLLRLMTEDITSENAPLTKVYESTRLANKEALRLGAIAIIRSINSMRIGVPLDEKRIIEEGGDKVAFPNGAEIDLRPFFPGKGSK